MSARLDPSPIGPDDIRAALLRVWAAALRDQSDAPADVRKLAGALCQILDVADDRQRQGKRLCALDETQRMMLAALRGRGFCPPADG